MTMKIERKVEFTWVDGKGIIDWKKKIWTNIIEKKRDKIKLKKKCLTKLCMLNK